MNGAEFHKEMIVGSNDTLIYIKAQEVPIDRKVTNGSFLYDYRALKDEIWRVRLVVRGEKLP